MTDTAWLRALPSLTGDAPTLAFDGLPDDPVVLFDTWIRHAAASGVAEPHAMTLSTVDAVARRPGAGGVLAGPAGPGPCAHRVPPTPRLDA